MRVSNSRLREWLGDRRGSVAILFSLTVIVLVLTIGLAIDGARAYNISTRVSAALDAAALAAAKMLDDPDNTDADIQERALRFFAAQLETIPVGGVSLGSPAVDIDRQRGAVEINVNVAVTTTLGQIAGLDKFEFPRSARVAFTQKFVELAMVLDITGSMCQPCDKIDGLKAAAHAAVANMINPSVPFGYNRIAIVPYSAAVNAGPFAADVSRGASTDGCVVERSGSHNADDIAPNGANALGVADWSANNQYTCPTPTVMPLTADRATLDSKIDSLTAGGFTAGHIGLAWGWYMLSKHWKNVWPAASKPKDPDPKVIKAVLLMTDGEFNTSYIAG
ncbi:MAG: pilus assembly protein, partial [Hyphomicrobiaceae bacterium]